MTDEYSQKTQRTLGFKLIAGVGALLLLTLGNGALAVLSIDRLGGQLTQASDVTARKIQLTADVRLAAQSMRTAQRGVILYSMMKQPERVSKAHSQFLEASQRISTLLTDLKPLVESQAEQLASDQAMSAVRNWAPLYQSVVSGCQKDDYAGTVKEAVDRTFTQADAIDRASDSLLQEQTAALAQSRQSAAATISSSRWMALGMLLLSLALGTVTLLVVRQATRQLRVIAQGLAQGAGQLLDAAGMISNSSQSLAQGASEQAASIEETSASGEEITAMAERNTENAGNGSRQVDLAVHAIRQVDDALAKMMVSIDDINSSSDKIAKIIKVIDGIAFQTNILALNAAVEAARAGEAGMGFAVVADEVRNLAQRCAQAARDTSELIEESVAKSRDGKARVEEVAGATQAIRKTAASLKLLVDEVSAGSREQSTGLAQISRAISQMQTVTQRTAADAEESASASEEMSSQAQSLQAMSADLDLMVNGVQSGGHLGQRVAAMLAIFVLLLSAGPLSAQSAGTAAQRPVRWSTTLQTGMAETLQLNLGGTFGKGPAWQNRFQTGLSNLAVTGDSLFLYGADSTDLRSAANDWQVGIGYKRPLLAMGRNLLSGGVGFQHWRFPSVSTGTNDWLTHENLTFQTRIRKMAATVTSDSWTLLKSPLPAGTMINTQVWLQHRLFQRESVQVAFRHGPAHTYSWGFYGTQGNRVFRYQTMLALSWKGATLEGGYRQQFGLRPGIPNNSYWQYALSRTF